MDVTIDNSVSVNETNTKNFVKTFIYTGLVAACELPYALVNQLGNLIGFEDSLYVNKDGSKRYRPSLTQRFLRRRLAGVHRRNSEYYQKKGKWDAANHALFYSVMFMDDVRRYNEAIKKCGLHVCLW